MESLTITKPLEKRPDYLHLGLLTVSPELQAAGIGRQLLEFAEAHARSIGKPKVPVYLIEMKKEIALSLSV